MTASFIIVYILPDHPPVLQIERFLAKDLIGVDQPVEYKAKRVSQPTCQCRKKLREVLLVGDAVSI